MVKFFIAAFCVIALFAGFVAATGSISVPQNVIGFIQSDNNLSIFSPNQSTIYLSRRVDVNVSTGGLEALSIKYSDNGDPFRRTLCRRCDSIFRRRPFDDGFHSVVFRADLGHEYSYGSVDFWVDSRDPRIRKTTPRRGYGSGEFTLEFFEVNPQSAILTYGNYISGYRMKEVNLSTCLVERDTWECSINVDLADFDEEEVTYWFDVSDIAQRTDSSREHTIDVDFSPPTITNISYSIDRRRVQFNIDVTELNFEKVSYIDLLDPRPRELTFCRRLDEGTCSVVRGFRNGQHHLNITAEDEAGNKASKEILFVI